MSKMSESAKCGFEVQSVSAALAKSTFACVARKGDVEVWASKSRLGPKGRRYTLVSFRALRVVSKDATTGRRTVVDLPLPETSNSDLVKVLTFLSGTPTGS